MLMSSPPDSLTEGEVEVALILRQLPELVLEDERRRSRLRWGFKKKRSSPSQDASPLPPSIAANEDGKSKPATVLSSHPSIGVEDLRAPEIPPPPVKQDEKYFMHKAREDSNRKRKDLGIPSHTIWQSSGRGPAESDMGRVDSPAFSLKPRPRLTLDLNRRPDEQEETWATEWQLRRQQVNDAAFARKRRMEIRRAKISSAAASKIYLGRHDVRHGDGI